MGSKPLHRTAPTTASNLVQPHPTAPTAPNRPQPPLQIGHFKSRLADVLDLPANKQKLNREGVGFLRDELTLAHYNVAPDVILTLGTKTRGRK